jgi:hypothetical protein
MQVVPAQSQTPPRQSLLGSVQAWPCFVLQAVQAVCAELQPFGQVMVFIQALPSELQV